MRDISAIQYKAGAIGYCHTVNNEGNNGYSIFAKSVINLWWSRTLDALKRIDTNYLEQPVDVFEDIKDNFYCPAYEVDGLLKRQRSLRN